MTNLTIMGQPKTTKQRVCGTLRCNGHLDKHNLHDKCAQCLPPSHFVMPQAANLCFCCSNFSDSSYRSRIHKRLHAGLPSSPGSEASSPLGDIGSVASSSETSDGLHGGSRPHSREASTTRDSCPSNPPRDTSTHSGGYGQEIPEASRKRKRAWDLP